MILKGNEDLRVVKTIESIKAAFEELICEKDYEKITVPPLEFTLRDQVGIRLQPEQLQNAAGQIKVLLSDMSYGGRIREIRDRIIANFGHSGEVGGQYLIDAVKAQIKRRTEKG